MNKININQIDNNKKLYDEIIVLKNNIKDLFTEITRIDNILYELQYDIRILNDK